VTETLLNQILLEREGEKVDRHNVKSIVNMLLSLNANPRMYRPTLRPLYFEVLTLDCMPPTLRLFWLDIESRIINTTSSVYESVFEEPFLQTSRTFYKLESETLQRTCDARDFLIQVEKRLIEEEERTQFYLSPNTEPKLRVILEQVLIHENVKTVADVSICSVSSFRFFSPLLVFWFLHDKY
jgi:hypothetical protein